MKIITLGAGPCGLGATYHLNQLGHSNWLDLLISSSMAIPE
jgi:protoporphyrinogen oxidase